MDQEFAKVRRKPPVRTGGIATGRSKGRPVSGFGYERTVTVAKIEQTKVSQNASAVEPVEVLSQLAQAEPVRAQAQIASLSLDKQTMLQSHGFSVPPVVLQQLLERQSPTQPAQSVPTPVHVRQEPRCLTTQPAGRSQSTLRGFFMGENAPNRGRTQDRAISVEKKSRNRSRPRSPSGFHEESDPRVSCDCTLS